MFFYCTTKVNNYYKVGIAESLSRVQKRLSAYRSIQPKIKMKLFSELGGSADDVEWSFKNKFDHFRVKKSECYKLKFDIIYKHFLKFQHKYDCLHKFWDGYTLFISEYYFDNQIPDENYDLTEKDQREGRFNGFFPVAKLNYKDQKLDKKGNRNIEAKYLDIKNVNLEEYKSKYNKFLKEKWYGKQRGYANNELDKFFIENFKSKKSMKAQSRPYMYDPIDKVIFNEFLIKYPKLIKRYSKKNDVGPFRLRHDQKPIMRSKSLQKIEKLEKAFEEKYNLDEILKGLSRFLTKKDPKNYLQVLYRIIAVNSFKAPIELKDILDKLETQLIQLINATQKRDKISDLIDKQKIRKNKKYDVLDNKIIKFAKIKK